MTVSRESAEAADTAPAADEFLIAVGDADGPLGTVEEHSLTGWAKGVVTRTAEEVHEDWVRVVGQTSRLVSAARAAVDGYDLDEVTFKLGFTAAGHIAFVSSAEVASSIKVTFRRRAPAATGHSAQGT